MATIGHTLVGLSLGTLCRPKTKNGILPYLWPGLLVFMAHLLDLVEWAGKLLAPTVFHHRLLTESPLLAAGVAVGACLVAAATRLRGFWTLLTIFIAILSHVVLDQPGVRILVADLSGLASGEEPGLFVHSLLSEIWLYGSALSAILLGQAISRSDDPSRFRKFGWIFLGLTALAAATRRPAVWLSAFSIVAVYCLLLHRRALRPRWAWSLVPLLPLVALVTVEVRAAKLLAQAKRLRGQGHYAMAITLHHRALTLPTRSSNYGPLLGLGLCYRARGDWARAEKHLSEAIGEGESPYWARFCLAQLYLDSEAERLGRYDPEKAVRLFNDVLAHPAPRKMKERVRRRIADLRGRGIVGGMTHPTKLRQ